MFTKKPEQPAIAGTPAPTQPVSEPIEQPVIEEKKTASHSFKMPFANRIKNFIIKAHQEHSFVLYYLLFFILSVGLLGALIASNSSYFSEYHGEPFFIKWTINILRGIGLRF